MGHSEDEEAETLLSRKKRSSVRFDIEDDDDDSDEDRADGGGQPHSSNTRGKEGSTRSGLSVMEALTESYKIIKSLVSLLFANTSGSDKMLLVIGSVCAIIHGVLFTFVAVVFGSMTNSFIQQSMQGYANSTSESYKTQGLHNFTQSLDVDVDKKVELPNAKAVGFSDQIAAILDLVNKIVVETFTDKQALTRDQFLEYVTITGNLFLVLAIVAFIASFIQVLCWECVAANQKFQLRESVITRILRQDMTWFGSHDIGEMIANVFGTVGYVREALGYKFCSVIENFAMFLCTTLIGLAINWKLALFFLAPMPFVIYRTLALGEKIASKSDVGENWTETEDFVSEALSNSDAVVAFGEQQNSVNFFAAKLEDTIDGMMKNFRFTALGKGGLAILIGGSYAIAFWYSCRLLIQGSIRPGEIYAVFLGVTMGTLAIAKIISSVSIFGTAVASAKNLEGFGKPLPKIDCLTDFGKVMEHPIPGEIEFLRVSFGFEESKKVLDDATFKIEAGKHVAILGDTGEGKTTIANLLLRLYDPTLGKIKVDGTNLTKFNVKNLRRHIGLATQQSLINYGESTNENIKAGRDISDKAVENSKKIADPLNFLLPTCDAYMQSHCKRKVNIARSIVNDPSILILDEPFMDLLSDEKESIEKNLIELRKRKTTVILTHDALGLENVDVIYVLKNGRIVETGTHSELVQREDGSAYKAMHQSATAAKSRTSFHKFCFASRMFTSRETVKIREKPPEGYLALYDISPTIKRIWTAGAIGCVIVGAHLALFAFYFVEIYGTFFKTVEQLADDGMFWAGMLLILAIVSGIGSWLKSLYMNAAALHLALTIRTTALRSIFRRPKLYYDKKKPKTSPAALGTTVLLNIPYIHNAMEYQVPDGISTTVTLFSIGLIVSLLVWQIGIIALVGVVPILIVLARVNFISQKMGRHRSCVYDDDSSNILSEAIQIIELVQSYTMQEYFIKKYKTAADPAIKEAHKQSLHFALLFGTCEALFFVFFGVSFLYGSFLIKNEVIHPEFLFKVFFATAFCVVSFSQTVSLMPDLGKAVASLEAINAMIREEYEFDADLDALNEEGQYIESVEGEIHFMNVSFKYANSGTKNVLNNLEFLVEKNKTILITGPPAFGGTTILYLMLRFYDPTSGGEVQLDSKNITGLNLRQLRENIGWVPQKFAFFQGSLSYNLKFGSKKPVKDEQLLEILRTVELYDELYKDLDSSKDDMYWSSLCRVNKVLISIARAILRDPKILLIDSPTARLTYEEKEKVVNVIKKVKEKRTCILISREPHITSIVDKIIVVKNGSVEREGTVEQLMAKEGYFKDWVQSSS